MLPAVLANKVPEWVRAMVPTFPGQRQSGHHSDMCVHGVCLRTELQTMCMIMPAALELGRPLTHAAPAQLNCNSRFVCTCDVALPAVDHLQPTWLRGFNSATTHTRTSATPAAAHGNMHATAATARAPAARAAVPLLSCGEGSVGLDIVS
jgi:hypothetical protein